MTKFDSYTGAEFKAYEAGRADTKAEFHARTKALEFATAPTPFPLSVDEIVARAKRYEEFLRGD